MRIKIEKFTFNFGQWQMGAFKILPDEEQHPELKDGLGIFTHGYTSHKGHILNWAALLAEHGMPSIIFDLPGHDLGTFGEVPDFAEFKAHAHELFQEVFRITGAILHKSTLILGGHSLGALLALKALCLPDFASKKRVAVAVGLGLQKTNAPIPWEAPTMQTLLDWRAQLVSPALSPLNVLPWLVEEKNRLAMKGETIRLISGEDDAVVGPTGAENLRDFLKAQGNAVSLDKVAHLPHDKPELAAVRIRNFLQELSIL
jgi:pimeloyl-ACP methyl ester carboxylesterase